MDGIQMERLHEETSEKNSLRYICRTCLKNIEVGETFLFINDFAKTLYFENLRISYMIEKSVPELDLDIIDSPIICNTCYNMLWYTYLFKLRCFQTEENIFLYVEKNKLNHGDKIDIEKIQNVEKGIGEPIINHTTDETKSVQNVICISDSDSKDEDGDDFPEEREEAERENEGEVEGDEDDDGDKIADSSNGKLSVDKEKPSSCQQYNYQASRSDLLKNDESHAKRVMKNYICHTCLYSTFRKKNLRKHNSLEHAEALPFVCGICEQRFTERYNLKNHMYKHSGKPLPFKCGEVGCKAAFARKCDLSVHIVTHISYSPNMCQECNKAFLSKEHLEKHRRKYHH